MPVSSTANVESDDLVTPGQTSDSTITQDQDRNSAPSPESRPAETMLDRVRAASRAPDASPASRTPDQSRQTDPTQSTADDVGEREFTEQEMAALNPRTQARMRKLTSDLSVQGRELETLKPKAVEYDKIESWIRRSGLQPRDVQSVAEIASMLVHNPVGARERLAPIMAELDRLLGVVLPPDLQQQVEQGYITQQHAQELSQARATAQLQSRRADRLVEDQQRSERTSQQRQAIDSSLSAMDAWERNIKKTDPDWSQKQLEVQDLVELELARRSQQSGQPWFPNPQEASQLLQKAYETINTRFKRFAPKPQAINPPANSGASPRSAPAPKSTMDIIRANIGR